MTSAFSFGNQGRGWQGISSKGQIAGVLILKVTCLPHMSLSFVSSSVTLEKCATAISLWPVQKQVGGQFSPWLSLGPLT